MSIAERTVRQITEYSNLPPSFDGNPFLYAASLSAVMGLACFGLAISGWMVRETWRDRYIIHPSSLAFMVRTVMMLVGVGLFVRTFPYMLYLQVYGDPDVSVETQALILSATRVADTLAFGVTTAWAFLFVSIYVPLMLALTSGPARYVSVDVLSSWPRLRRPVFIFAVIVLLSVAFAYGKVYGR